jgi:FkbM family methyltransferase
MNKEYILNLLQKARKDCIEFEREYQGGSLYKKIKRLLKYKGKYLEYVLAKMGINRKFSFLSYFGILNMGLREIKTAEFFIKNIKLGDVFYDIGANQGFFSLLIKEAFGDEVEVHSFEPIEDNFIELTKNLNKYQNIFLNIIALSDYIGEINFKIPKNKFLLGHVTVVDDFAKKFLKNNYIEVKAKCITLDEYCKTHKPPTYIKLDVEGSEQFVVEGGKETLNTFSPVIIMEIVTGDIGINYSLKAAKKLENLDYKVYEIDDFSGNVKFISYEELENFIKNKLDIVGDNFLFLRNNGIYKI